MQIFALGTGEGKIRDYAWRFGALDELDVHFVVL